MAEQLKTPRPARKRPHGRRKHDAGTRKRKRLAVEANRNAGRSKQTVARPAKCWQPPHVDVFTPDRSRRDYTTGEVEDSSMRAVRKAMRSTFRFGGRR